MVIFEHWKHDTIGKLNRKLLGRNLKAQLRAEGNIKNGLSNRLSNSIEIYFYVRVINYIKSLYIDTVGFHRNLASNTACFVKKIASKYPPWEKVSKWVICRTKWSEKKKKKQRKKTRPSYIFNSCILQRKRAHDQKIRTKI